MAVIKPIKGVRFTEKAGLIENLVCPPYDIIPKNEQQRLSKIENNIINLEFSAAQNPYEAAKGCLNEMLSNGIIEKDSTESYYIYEINFKYNNEEMKFRGIIFGCFLTPFSEGVVLPHEETLSKAKEDRLNLMKATNFNFSNIYSLFSDEGDIVEQIMERNTKEKPQICFTDGDGVTHKLWAVTDRAECKAITEAFVDKKLYIADGHHRYETGCNYKNYLKNEGKLTENANYIMMMAVAIESPGLLVLPTHRVVFGLSDFSAPDFFLKISDNFDIEACDEGAVESELQKCAETGKQSFAVYTDGEFKIITLKDGVSSVMLNPDIEKSVAALDVTLLHKNILEKHFGIDKEVLAAGTNLSYTRDIAEAKAAVDNKTAQISFILNATKVEQIKEVSGAGGKMPQKSTYFYPKLITGLVINDLS